MIPFGGDCAFDTAGPDRTRSLAVRGLRGSVLKDHCSLPWRAGIGNHDVFGIGKSVWEKTRNDPLFGKKTALDQFGEASAYYSFDQGGWHFIVLDGIHVKRWRLQGRDRRGAVRLVAR